MKSAKFLLPMLLMLLAGCGQDAAPAPAVPSPATAREAYVQVLETLLHDHILPDGTDCSADFDPEYVMFDPPIMEENEFAVQDVDGDGQQELILSYVTTSSANQRLYVLDWDEETGETRVQLTEYPNLLAVYDNGAIQAGWSHDQTRSGLWPYTLYVYDAETDSYINVGVVSAWDSLLALDGYPADIDVSGSGTVYYLYEDVAAQYGEIDPVDESVYLDRMNDWLGDASPVDIAYLPLTEETVQQVLNIP